jgi:hypothetical protein
MSTNAQFPPYEMTTDDGEFEGIDIETAGKAIADKLGLELQIDDMDFDAALLAVQQGKSDMVMAGVTVTDERKNVMDFSDTYANRHPVHHRARKIPILPPWTTWPRQEDRHPARHHRLHLLLQSVTSAMRTLSPLTTTA